MITLRGAPLSGNAALSHMGGIPLDDHPAVRAWIERIRALPGLVSMEGSPRPSPVDCIPRRSMRGA